MRGVDSACDLFNAGVGVRNVAWKGAVGESFAGGVLPGAVEVIICADEFEADTSGEGDKGGAA